MLATLDRIGSTGVSTEVARRLRRTQYWGVGVAAAIVAALIAVAALKVHGSGGDSLGRPAVAPAIAVLPFQSLSGDTANEYFSDGMTEELIATLARVHALRIPSRAATFAYKGKQHDSRDVGGTLHVQAILTGSVRRAGDRVRVAVQLVNASDGRPLWTEEYDRTV